MGFCPEGAEQISPGQRPGTTRSNRTQALKGRHKAPELFRPFRAQVTIRPDPRALPWADLFGPFGAKGNDAGIHAIVSILQRFFTESVR
jgi:hypothetical protein